MGNETHKAYYCINCGWRSHAFAGDWATKPECPRCNFPLRFVKFNLDERGEAERIAGGKLHIIPALTSED